MYVAVVLADLRKLAINLLSVTLIIWTWAFHRFVCALSVMYYYVNPSCAGESQPESMTCMWQLSSQIFASSQSIFSR